MAQKETVYTPPKHSTQLPTQIVTELDGDHLESRLHEAIRLSTVSEDGWPHAAQLSIGEVLAVNPSELLIAIWPDSNTVKNLKRDGRLTLSLVANGGLFEMRSHAILVAEHQTTLDLAVFRIRIEAINEHRSSYADVTSGVTFRLQDEARTIARWREQIASLKALI